MSGTIERCAQGIPTLTAPTPSGLARLQGRATAEDRAWQLAVDGWRLAGESAARLGKGHAELDRLVSAVDLPGLARRCFDRAAPHAQDFAAAYADGVNGALPAALAQDRIALTAGLEDAAPHWEPWTPVGFMLLAHLLMGAFPETLWREHARRTVGPDLAPLLLADPPRSSGSNAWLVPGRLTADGRPLLCADPHRLLEWPGPYHQVRLRGPGIRADGLAFPGFPGVPHFGQTASAAWVVTNAMADNQPLIRGPGRPETGAHPGSPFPEAARDADGPLHLAWSPMVHGDGGLGTSLALLRAASAEDVAAAFASWTDPVNRVIAADVSGNALSFTAGRVPRLPEESRLWAIGPQPPDPRGGPSSPAVPRKNDDGARPPGPRAGGPTAAEMPGGGMWEERPVSRLEGLWVDANEHKQSERRLGFASCSPQRAERIRELLDALAESGPIRAEDASRVALDTLDRETRSVVRQCAAAALDLAAAADSAGPGPAAPSSCSPPPAPDAAETGPDDQARALLARIAAWDGRFDAHSRTASEVSAWRHELIRLIAAEPMLAPLGEDSGLSPLFAPWLDPASRIGYALPTVIRHAPRFGLDLGHLALEAARRAAAVGPARPWGESHCAIPLATLPSALEPAPRGLIPAPIGTGGDGGCVLAASSSPGHSDASLRAPSARVTWVVGDPDSSRWVVPWGAAGSLSSPHASDQASAWAEGRTFGVSPAPGVVPSPAARHTPIPPVKGDTVHEHLSETTDLGGGFTLRPLDPTKDAEIVHAWTRDERAQFWGMSEQTLEEIRGIYDWLDESETHHAYAVCLDGAMIAVFQTYDPRHDEVGTTFEVRDGDLGVHFMMGPRLPDGAGPAAPGRVSLTSTVLAALAPAVLRATGARRIVAEPDARNHRALARLTAAGFRLGDEVWLEGAGKTARLAFLEVNDDAAAALGLALEVAK
ncbi:GNAT family N-acetyltransferase [Falsarthrobacter nasiphocae]|uniref:Lysine N-acyltransferase MbtK n=1 Tax=Falsarthrobacter nasiphocae TaxID=189863 RepID=A0AAE4C6D0_9MICC|nr:GNAT family N-acetyltransferase [Falsarthrobacter nasiphocae]MDR6892027.1 penicillin amidase [Falsarthrobacter nasiphocae]